VAVETITDSDFEAFIAKLNSVDFTDKERSLLRGIFAAAVPAEVEGFDGGALWESLSPSQQASASAVFPPKSPAALPNVPPRPR